MFKSKGPRPPEKPRARNAGNRSQGPVKQGGKRRLAIIGVAGQSAGVLAGAAGWRISDEPAWIVMSVISFALAVALLRHV